MNNTGQLAQCQGNKPNTALFEGIIHKVLALPKPGLLSLINIPKFYYYLCSKHHHPSKKGYFLGSFLNVDNFYMVFNIKCISYSHSK